MLIKYHSVKTHSAINEVFLIERYMTQTIKCYYITDISVLDQISLGQSTLDHNLSIYDREIYYQKHIMLLYNRHFSS